MRGKGTAATGSVLAAMASSACCWLPLVLMGVGLSAAGVGTFFERYRPYFLVVAVVLLGVWFYFNYFRFVRFQNAMSSLLCSGRVRPTEGDVSTN